MNNMMTLYTKYNEIDDVFSYQFEIGESVARTFEDITKALFYSKFYDNMKKNCIDFAKEHGKEPPLSVEKLWFEDNISKEIFESK